MGSGRHHYSPGLFLPFLPQPPPWQPLSSQRVGWGGEEGADPGGGGRGERRTEEALPPPSQPPTPPPPLPEGQQPHILNRARAWGCPCQAEDTQGPGVTHARQRAHRALYSGSRPGGGFPLRLRRNSPVVRTSKWPWKSSSPLLHGIDEETKAHACGAQSTPWPICSLLLRIARGPTFLAGPSPWAEEPHTSRTLPTSHPCFLASSSLVERLEASSGSLLGPLTCLLGVGSSPPIATAQRLAGFTLPPQANCSNWASPMEEEAVPINVPPATGFHLSSCSLLLRVRERRGKGYPFTRHVCKFYNTFQVAFFFMAF